MKRAALYMRVSTVDQHPETQLLDLRQMVLNEGTRSSPSTPTRSVARRPKGRGSIR
jgi:DNA invertase Pin-like site-specific DNA recombinase